MALARDVDTLARWLVAITENSHVLLAIFHKPSVRYSPVDCLKIVPFVHSTDGLLTALFSRLVSLFLSWIGAFKT